jgi:hypothetical protein
MYFQPLEGPIGGPNPVPPFSGVTEGQGPIPVSTYPGASGGGDAISRLVPPWITNGMTENPLQNGLVGPLPSLIQQLLSTLQSMMGYGGGSTGAYGGGAYGTGAYGAGGSSGPLGNEQYFANASGGSDGDPHLSFNGNDWSSMASQPDLLESNSVPGGFRVSTQTTAPNAKGVTWNRSATVALNNGATSVSMNNRGEASIESYGQRIPISSGQTVQLGNGTSVSCNQNGSLTVLAQTADGGQISTSLTAKGQGVDVDVNAQNVDLGGALVNGQQSPAPPVPLPAPLPLPIQQPYPY